MKKLEQIFSNHKFKIYANASEIFMLEYLRKSKDCKFLLYGAGNMAAVSLKYLQDILDIEVEFILDKFPKADKIQGKKVLSLTQFSELDRKENEKWCAIVDISSYRSSESLTKEIDQYLENENIYKIVGLGGQVSSITKGDWYEFFVSNKQEFCENEKNFSDEISKDTYKEYISCYLEGRRYNKMVYPENTKYFQVNDLTYKIIHREDECWINMGAYNGDTIYHFINEGYSFEKIYAIEGDTETAKILKNNLEILPQGIKNKIKIVNKFFGNLDGQEKIDDYFAGHKITMINMDIEGSELEVLKSANCVIKDNRPILAISVYHKKDDLLLIPKEIERIVSNYSFFLRKYPSLIGGYFDGYFELNELVLYAIPNERIYMG